MPTALASYRAALIATALLAGACRSPEAEPAGASSETSGGLDGRTTTSSDGAASTSTGADDGGTTSGASTTSSGDLDVSAFLSEQRARECELWRRCRIPYLAEPDLEACAADQVEYDAPLVNSVMSGRTLFDADAGAVCLANFESVDCSEFGVTLVDEPDTLYARFDQVPGCADVFTGGVEQDAQCYWYSECQPGLECAGSGVCLAEGATCVPVAGAGEPCHDEYCGDPNRPTTLYCDLDALLCEPIVADGEPCTEHVQCRTGHLCVGGVCSGGASVATGEPCIAQSQCTGSDVCMPTADGTSLVCRAPLASAEACPPGSEGWMFCSSLEESCLDLGDGAVCRAPSAVGGPCNGEEDCGNIAWCDLSQTPGICVAPSSEGGPCPGIGKSWVACEDGLYCAENTCVAKLAGGASCSGQVECAGYCDAGVCVDVDCTVPARGR